ncbi:MAG: hypothetical protein MUF78_06080 [Candidatus Edwardsbacteria bacterium]|jgi:hypothetical protein|nr:hypothetical protein [Candidatus Edwardsbacteria bacterium]
MPRRTLIRWSCLLAALLPAACAPRYAVRAGLPAAEQEGRREIMAYAATLVGTGDLRAVDRSFRNDCSGYVNGVFAISGRPIAYAKVRRDRPLSESLYRSLEHRGLVSAAGPPAPADAVFFRNTYDTPYDCITHVGLVEAVGDDGTVTILHYASGRVGRIRMNLRRPDVHRDAGGRVLNDYVRKSRDGSPRKDYLAGRLFQAFGDLYRYTSR